MADIQSHQHNINIKKLALFAGLDLNDSESALDEVYLNKMLNWATEEMSTEIDIQQLDTVTHAFNTTQPLRADVVTEMNQRDAYQALAPQVEEGLYLVPLVIE